MQISLRLDDATASELESVLALNPYVTRHRLILMLVKAGLRYMKENPEGMLEFRLNRPAKGQVLGTPTGEEVPSEPLLVERVPAYTPMVMLDGAGKVIEGTVVAPEVVVEPLLTEPVPSITPVEPLVVVEKALEVTIHLSDDLESAMEAQDDYFFGEDTDFG